MPYWVDQCSTCYSLTTCSVSDYRLKENLSSWTGLCCSSNIIKNTPVYKFNWNETGASINLLDGTSKNKIGFLAHEVQNQTAGLSIVSGTKDETFENGEIKPQGLDQTSMIPILWAALQETISKVESLESRIQALES